MQLQTQTRRELENLEDPSANDPEADESTIDDYDDHNFHSYEDDDGAEDD